jgi:hypothetical protein
MTTFFQPVGTISAEQPEDNSLVHPMYISPFAGSSTPIGYNVAQIRTAYNLPSSGGAGTTIAIIDAYDTPNILTYFNAFSSQFGLPDNSTGDFLVHKMSQSMGTDSGWALETCLDVEWAHAIAPNATILLVEAVNAGDSALLAAVDYATSQPGVVAVSMSWGRVEFSTETSFFYENHFNKPGITFFASSGDDGMNVLWPAASASVVSVGGTTLKLNPDGTVISETAWSDSSGGVSNYVARPAYQTSYGLTYPNRAVPDVSYNGNASTGVAVYNGTWWKVGGTSAGAPQWAAIHALGLSSTNNNLYARAKSAYSSYFRDITSGSNGAYNASTGYDCVTGLGSPLTVNFGTTFEVSPTSGPAGTSITLNGVGFSGSSVNISYLNPANSWVPVINNLTTVSGNFTYPMNAPDLLQSNPAGDNPPASNSIVFRAQDNSNGFSTKTTVPYTEWRRGLTQIGNSTATGIYGNNTNFATSIFVQNGDAIPICGKWFSPGNATFQWDGTVDLGTSPIDDNGMFNTSLVVPATTAGPHNFTINDGGYNFCINLTRLPTVANDYTDEWHTSDFAINLSPDYNVDETFYRINNGPPCNVSADGQPTIITEGDNNTLEYWSTLNGTGTMELQHVTVTGIKLDKTAPMGSITPSSSTVYTPTITLFLTATDDVSGVGQMRFSNGGNEFSNWESYVASKTWTLQESAGVKTVTVQYMDSAGLTSMYSCTVTLATSNPSPNPQATSSPTATPMTQTALPSDSPTTQPSATPQIPELNLQAVLILITVSTLMLMLVWKRRRK